MNAKEPLAEEILKLLIHQALDKTDDLYDYNSPEWHAFIKGVKFMEAKSKEEAEEKIDIESMCMSILKKYGLESESLIGGQQTLALMVECVEAAFGKEGEG